MLERRDKYRGYTSEKYGKIKTGEGRGREGGRREGVKQEGKERTGGTEERRATTVVRLEGTLLRRRGRRERR